MKSILPLLLFVLVLSSCTSAYKTGQTPDDVYFSPARPQDEYVRTERSDERKYRYDEADRDDRYLRMKIRDRRYTDLYDDYYSYNPYYYHYYNGSLYYNSPWSSHSYWNNYYNPTCRRGTIYNNPKGISTVHSDHVCSTWAFIIQITIQVRLHLQKVPDMVAILLPTQPIIQVAALAQIPEGAVITTVEAVAMPGTLSGKRFLIQATTTAEAAIAQASRQAPIPQVQVVQVPEAAVAVQTHGKKILTEDQYNLFIMDVFTSTDLPLSLLN